MPDFSLQNKPEISPLFTFSFHLLLVSCQYVDASSDLDFPILDTDKAARKGQLRQTSTRFVTS